MEASHQHVRKQGKVKRRFKNPLTAQRFLSLSLNIRNIFGRNRHKLSASFQRMKFTMALDIWNRRVTQ